MSSWSGQHLHAYQLHHAFDTAIAAAIVGTYILRSDVASSMPRVATATHGIGTVDPGFCAIGLCAISCTSLCPTKLGCHG